MTILATALTVIAIVTQDQSVLRAAPREPAAQHAVLWQGDSLEIRGSKGDRLQVHDPRRERPGYLQVSQVRQLALKPENASELLAVVRFLRDRPGVEALGISYAAACRKGAPAEAIDGRGFDALGTFAERLARVRKPLLTRCTYGIVWTVEVVPPPTDYPNLGYVEFAGWVPRGAQMLAAREAKVEGCHKQSFALINLSSPEVECSADKPASLTAVFRWQSPAWKAQTLSVR
ncbi:MAG: hypothetical protein V5B32_13760 [Candidatus Accumulibacter sp. UW26]|jgi:hypothetical protein